MRMLKVIENLLTESKNENNFKEIFNKILRRLDLDTSVRVQTKWALDRHSSRILDKDAMDFVDLVINNIFIDEISPIFEKYGDNDFDDEVELTITRNQRDKIISTLTEMYKDTIIDDFQREKRFLNQEKKKKINEDKDKRLILVERFFDEVFDNLELVRTYPDIVQCDFLEKGTGRKVFERNHWGRLWIYGCNVYRGLRRKITGVLDFTKEEFHELLLDYVSKRYKKEFDGRPLLDIDSERCSEFTGWGEIDESEITEKCWKGYTQKGMKTMFGKRYPNCVKKKKKLNEETLNIDPFVDKILNKFPNFEPFVPKLKNFIENSNCQKIDFASFKFPALGLALHDGVLINENVLSMGLGMLLFVIFHEIAHQYQYKKYSAELMYKIYVGEMDLKEAVDTLRKVEMVADEFGLRKLREFKTAGLNISGGLSPRAVYKNVPEHTLTEMLKQIRDEIKQSNIKSQQEVAEYFYNKIKKEL